MEKRSIRMKKRSFHVEEKKKRVVSSSDAMRVGHVLCCEIRSPAQHGVAASAAPL